MGYPRSLLGEDEEIELELRPHWRQVIPAALVLLVVVPVAAFGAAALPDWSVRPWLRWAILAVAVVLVLRWSVLPFLRWVTESYTITGRRIIVRSGIVSRRGHDMPMSRVTDVSFEQGLLDRIMRSGTLIVESSGERGQLVLDDVPRVQQVQREIYRLHEQDDDRRRWHRDDEPKDVDQHDDGAAPPDDGSF